MKKINFMDTSFRDGFQSCYGARVKTEDFTPILSAALEAGNDNFEIGGGARFQSLYFYCQEDAFDMMDKSREIVGKDINLQTLARGANVVGLESQSRDIINLHAKLFKKHGITTIRNFDALMDIRNLSYSGECITNAGLNHQIVIALMGLPPSLNEKYFHSSDFYTDKIKEILKADIPFDSLAFKDASGTTPPSIVYESVKNARKLLPEGTMIQFHTHDTAGMAISSNMAAIEGGADMIDLAMAPVSGGTSQTDILSMWQALRGTEYTLDIQEEKEDNLSEVDEDEVDNLSESECSISGSESDIGSESESETDDESDVGVGKIELIKGSGKVDDIKEVDKTSSIKELKDICQKLGISSSGNKESLIKRINEKNKK